MSFKQQPSEMSFKQPPAFTFFGCHCYWGMVRAIWLFFLLPWNWNWWERDNKEDPFSLIMNGTFCYWILQLCLNVNSYGLHLRSLLLIVCCLTHMIPLCTCRFKWNGCAVTYLSVNKGTSYIMYSGGLIVLPFW